MSERPIRIVVIGAGAAGLVAAAESAKCGAQVILLEKNSKTGVKILMSGGTRCNLTHDTDARGITDAFGHAKRFLQFAVGRFPPTAVVEMFHTLGVFTKTESTGKVFPTSDRAVQVRDALRDQAITEGVDIRLRCGVQALRQESGLWTIDTENDSLSADRVIVTAGGKSWPGCGTTGDAYDWLKDLGHTIIPPRPALVPLVGGHLWMNEMSGVTLGDTILHVNPSDARGKSSKSSKSSKTKSLIQRRAGLLLTHFGLSGPAAMDVSGTMTAAARMADVQLTIDFLPEISEAQIREELSNRSGDQARRSIANVIGRWLPNRLADEIVRRTGDNVTLSQINKKQVQEVVRSLKSLETPISGTKGFAKAEVTAGGVDLAEVDPKTMESRKAPGLFIAGEVLDVDGWIGGYNFQAAFSTGRLAGIAAAQPRT